MKEENDINTYLIEAMDMKNYVKAFDEEIANKTLINTLVNRLLWSYKMVIQGITYMIQPTFEDIKYKLLIKTHCMAIKEQKLV